MIQLNSIENRLKQFDYNSLYDINLRKVIDNIYNELMRDENFVEQMGQKLNSKSDLYNMYKRLKGSLLILFIHRKVKNV